jgi:hypothetical protein
VACCVRYVPRKTRYERMAASEKPILPVLADIIARSATGEYGKPFTSAGFGGWFTRCDEAGLRRCTAHGLRDVAAEAGATDRQLMAMFDWTKASQATSIPSGRPETACSTGGPTDLWWGTLRTANCPTEN